MYHTNTHTHTHTELVHTPVTKQKPGMKFILKLIKSPTPPAGLNRKQTHVRKGCCVHVHMLTSTHWHSVWLDLSQDTHLHPNYLWSVSRYTCISTQLVACLQIHIYIHTSCDVSPKTHLHQHNLWHVSIHTFTSIQVVKYVQIHTYIQTGCHLSLDTHLHPQRL